MSRFTDPTLAIEHVRRVARETAAEAGHRAAATALLAVRQEYRIMPLHRGTAPAERVATWDAVRDETRVLVPMACGDTADKAIFDERVALSASQLLPQLPDGTPGPSLYTSPGLDGLPRHRNRQSSGLVAHVDDLVEA